MTTIHLDNRQGTQVLAQFLNPSDHAICTRCGVDRKTNSSRAAGLCRDCRTVETHAARIAPEPAVGVWVFRRGIRVLVTP